MFARDTLGSALPVTTPDGRTPTSAMLPAAIPSVATAPERGFYLLAGKRLTDIVVSLGLLLLLSPVFILAALWVLLDSPGSVFFRSQRVGKGGKLFTFWKFRSMVKGADSDKAKLLHMNEVDGPVFKLSQDPRITRAGRFLRRTSIDELPQLVHVLTGQMSLVGPRPPEPQEVLEYEPWQLRRLAVRPGLTCLWQVSGRSLIGFDEWMRLDLEYIDHRSFAMDVKILLRTLPAVVSGRGAF
jgi:lipopolysaccharide/colanic/teichoic acid biosynthesis glycosyltransferase